MLTSFVRVWTMQNAAALLIAYALALAKFVAVSWTRVLVATIAFVVSFWVGYFQTWVEGPDTDILLAYFVLGSAVWLGNVPINGHRLAGAVALLGFPIASVVGELFLLVAFTLLQVTPAIQTSEIQHSVFWITVGGVTGILGGWLSGLALSRMLPELTAHRPEQTLAADALSPQD